MLLIINTFFLCLFILLFSFSSWNSYILFIIFLGGILILFLYNISLISSEIFYFSFKKYNIIVFFFFLFIHYFKERILNDISNYISLIENCPVLTLFLTYNCSTVLFLITYLFLTLICIVNLIYFSKDKGSVFLK